MTNTKVHHASFDNGLTLLCEPMTSVRSAAYTMLVPLGAMHDPSDRLGMAALLSEWITRGAGRRSGPELLGALDELGVSHGESAHTAHLSLSGATLGRSLLPALAIVADMVLRPHLADGEVEAVRALLLQSLRSIEDDPSSKVAIELRRRHYPDPWGRPTQGTLESLQLVSADDARTHFHALARPRGTLLAVAGAVDWTELLAEVKNLLGDWPERAEPTLKTLEHVEGSTHLDKETQQIQIAAAIPSVVVAHPEYYHARASAAILGGYASSRLFTEVREKRGLCYSIFATFESFRDRASMICQAGTAPDRAQETLDVLLMELERLRRDGVNQEELDTMRAGLKSSLIMQQESSASRAMAIASDWYYLGRVRPIEEIGHSLNALTAVGVSEFCSRIPLNQTTLVTLGPKALRHG